jgi:hypothetical protein
VSPGALLADIFGPWSAPRSLRGRPLDAIVSHAEICDKHGTGVLVERLFGDGNGVVTVRSRNDHDGTQRFGEIALRLRHRDRSREQVTARVRRAFQGLDVHRMLAIPYYPDDVRTALALKDVHAPALCTYLMDDRNIEARGIPDGLLRELLVRSDLRLAISAELREAYQAKFGVRLWVLPPVAPAKLVLPRPTVPPGEVLGARRGVMVGNVWGAHWLERLCEVVRGAGVELDWYNNAGLTQPGLTARKLADAGVFLRGAAPEPELNRILRGCAWVVVPSGTLDAADTHRFIARFSLPSRIPYVLATSHAPLLVLGHPETAAARFVRATGIGLAIPYDPSALRDAAAALADSAVQARIRACAAALAPRFSSEGVREWLWRSLEAHTAIDDRFERLLAGNEACA